MRANFAFTDSNGKVRSVSKASNFATALEQQKHDFDRIRGIANAAKHLELTDIRPVANAPSRAANTAIQTAGPVRNFSVPPFCDGSDPVMEALARARGLSRRGPYGGNAQLMLARPNGNDMEFSDILRSVYKMWETLTTAHRW